MNTVSKDGVVTAKGLVCIHCKTEIPKFKSMVNRRDGQFHKGQIMVCSSCLHVMVLGDSSWHPMTPKEFAALPGQTQHQLLAIAKGLEGLMKEGGVWTPYGAEKKS